MKSRKAEPDKIVDVRRGPGKIRRVETAGGRVFPVVDKPENSRYIEPGAGLDAGDIEVMEGRLAAEAGIQIAVGMLSRRDRTERQIRKALAAENIDNQETIDYIVETLRRRGYIDDRRFAGEFIGYRLRARPAGPALLRKKLIEAGVGSDIVDEEVSGAFADGEEARLAENLAAEKLARMKGIDIKRAARRMHGFLSRRGFSAGIVNGICAGILRNGISGD